MPRPFFAREKLPARAEIVTRSLPKMNFFMLVVLAILIAASAFGLNQVMLLSQDVKYIRSVLTSHLDKILPPVKQEAEAPAAAPAAVTAEQAARPAVAAEQPPKRPDGVPPPRNDAISMAASAANAWADAAEALAKRSLGPQ